MQQIYSRALIPKRDFNKSLKQFQNIFFYEQIRTATSEVYLEQGVFLFSKMFSFFLK